MPLNLERLGGGPFLGHQGVEATSLYTTTPTPKELLRSLQLLSAAGFANADPLIRALTPATRKAADVLADEIERHAPQGSYPASSGYSGRAPAHRAGVRYAQFGHRKGRLVRAGALKRTVRVKPSRTRARVLIGGRYRSDEVWYVDAVTAGHPLSRNGRPIGRIPANPFIWNAARAKSAEMRRLWQNGIDDILAEMAKAFGTTQVTGSFAAARSRRAA